MATIRKASGTLKVTASLASAQTIKEAGGGYSIKIKTDDEAAINLVSRARKNANAEITFEFFEIEEVVDPEDPSQQELDGLQDD